MSFCESDAGGSESTARREVAVKPAKSAERTRGKVAAERSTHRTLNLTTPAGSLDPRACPSRAPWRTTARASCDLAVCAFPDEGQSEKRSRRDESLANKLAGGSRPAWRCLVTANGAARRPRREPWTIPTTRRRSPRSRGTSAICTPTSEVRLRDDRRARRRRAPRVRIFAIPRHQRQPLVPPRRTLTKPTPSRAPSSVSRDATDEEIKRAYRNLAQVAHPDKHASPALREVRPGALPVAVLGGRAHSRPIPASPRSRASSPPHLPFRSPPRRPLRVASTNSTRRTRCSATRTVAASTTCTAWLASTPAWRLAASTSPWRRSRKSSSAREPRRRASVSRPNSTSAARMVQLQRRAPVRRGHRAETPHVRRASRRRGVALPRPQRHGLQLGVRRPRHRRHHRVRRRAGPDVARDGRGGLISVCGARCLRTRAGRLRR